MTYPLERPPAEPNREEMAASLHASGLAPEEFAARHAHEIACFSLDEVRYADPVLDAWIRRLGDILFRREGAPRLDDLRARYLTPEERAIVERERDEL